MGARVHDQLRLSLEELLEVLYSGGLRHARRQADASLYFTLTLLRNPRAVALFTDLLLELVGEK